MPSCCTNARSVQLKHDQPINTQTSNSVLSITSSFQPTSRPPCRATYGPISWVEQLKTSNMVNMHLCKHNMPTIHVPKATIGRRAIVIAVLIFLPFLSCILEIPSIPLWKAIAHVYVRFSTAAVDTDMASKIWLLINPPTETSFHAESRIWFGTAMATIFFRLSDFPEFEGYVLTRPQYISILPFWKACSCSPARRLADGVHRCISNPAPGTPLLILSSSFCTLHF